jgi:hypothetical protein
MMNAAANNPEDKPVDILQEFLTALVEDQWVDQRIKMAARAALRHYEPEPAKTEEQAT